MHVCRRYDERTLHRRTLKLRSQMEYTHTRLSHCCIAGQQMSLYLSLVLSHTGCCETTSPACVISTSHLSSLFRRGKKQSCKWRVRDDEQRRDGSGRIEMSSVSLIDSLLNVAMTATFFRLYLHRSVTIFPFNLQHVSFDLCMTIYVCCRSVCEIITRLLYLKGPAETHVKSPNLFS